MPYESYEALEVWKRSREVAITVCRQTRGIRNHALRDQMVRSAISIPSNIAEGYERHHKLERVQFVGIAKGSSAELCTQVGIAGEIDEIPAKLASELETELRIISAMLHKLVLSWGFTPVRNRNSSTA